MKDRDASRLENCDSEIVCIHSKEKSVLEPMLGNPAHKLQRDCICLFHVITARHPIVGLGRETQPSGDIGFPLSLDSEADDVGMTPASARIAVKILLLERAVRSVGPAHNFSADVKGHSPIV
jgi:hypothetical protein